MAWASENRLENYQSMGSKRASSVAFRRDAETGDERDAWRSDKTISKIFQYI